MLSFQRVSPCSNEIRSQSSIVLVFLEVIVEVVFVFEALPVVVVEEARGISYAHAKGLSRRSS